MPVLERLDPDIEELAERGICTDVVAVVRSRDAAFSVETCAKVVKG